jgi:HD-GYP domain-containing protein (c-di-GMP phosphodiesterase class II)
MYWNFNTQISVIATILFLALFLVVFFSKPRTQLRKLFLVYLITMTIWSISAFLASSGLAPVLPWFRVMAASPMAMLLSLYLLVQNLFGLRSKWKPLFILYGFIAILLNISSSLVVKSAFLDSTGMLVYNFGFLLPIIALPGTLLVVHSLILLLKGYKISKDAAHRNRIRYLTLGLLIPLLASAVNFTALGKYPIDLAANVITAFLIAYAILRNQLLDTRVVVRLGLLYSITTISFGVIYFLGISLVLNLFHLLPTNEIFLLSILLGTLVAFILAPIRNRIQNWIDRRFYREKYNAGLMLQRLSQATASLMDLDQISDLILKEVLTTWHIQNGAVLIRKSDSGEFRVIAQHDENRQPIWNFPPDHPVATWLSNNQKTLTSNDISMLPVFKSLWGKEKEELEKFQAEIFIPICFKGNLVGILILGEKRSSQPYEKDDLVILSALSNQTAVAVENARLYEELQSAFVETTVALANAIDIRDNYTNVHSQQIADWASKTAKLLGCKPQEIDDIYWGGLLHDIGKIGIPDAILNKAARLDSSEWEVIHRHPNLGADLILPIKKLVNVAPIIRYSHERFDGGGYPMGLRGEEIPLGARIVSVADSYSAMIDKRPYKEPLSEEKAMQELIDNSGKMYDPQVVEAFLKLTPMQKNSVLH